MGKIILRNGTYYAHYRDAAGVFQRKSTYCSDPKAARQWLAAAERRETDPSRPKDPLHLADAINYYLDNVKNISDATHQLRFQKAENLLRIIGAVDVHKMTKADIRKYIENRSQETRGGKKNAPISDHTIAKELITLRVVLKFLSDRDMWEGSIETLFPQFSPNYTPRDTFLTPEQYAKMKDNLPFRNARVRYALWCDLAVYLGGRYSEVCKIEWSDLDLKRKVALIRGTKTKKSWGYVPIPDPLHEVLEPVKKNEGLVVGDWSNCYRELATACERAAVPRVTPNDLRRTYCSWLIQEGVPLKHAAELMRHSTTHMVDTIYGRLNMETLEKATAKLPGMVGAKPVEKPTQSVSVFRYIEID